MIRAVALALGDLAAPAVLRVFGRALAEALLLFGLGAVALGWALRGVDPCAAVDLGACPFDGAASGLGAALLTVGFLWLLFPAVAMGMVAAHGDRIVAAVEARHYAGAAPGGRSPGWVRLAGLGLRSAGRLLLLNLLALPAVVVLLVTGIGPVLLLVAVNGYAIGQDAGELVAAHHGEAGRAWLRASRGPRFVGGVGCAALFLVPVANLLAPLLIVALAVHLFHRRPAR